MTWEGIKVVTAPTSNPISTADMKARLRVDFTDEDDVIAAMIAGAVARIDGPRGIGIAMMAQTWRLTLDAFPSEFRLPGWPITSVASIKYDDADGVEQTITSSNYRVDLNATPVRVAPVSGYAWPAPLVANGVVRVEYVLGQVHAADVPADLVDAVAMLAAERYENREAATDGTRSPLAYGVDMILAEYRQAHAG